MVSYVHFKEILVNVDSNLDKEMWFLDFVTAVKGCKHEVGGEQISFM